MALTASCFASLTYQQQQALLYEALLANIAASEALTPSVQRVAVAVARPANQTPYTAGDIVTTGFNFTGIVPVAGDSFMIRNAYLVYGAGAIPATMTTFTLHLYNVAQTVVDNAAFDLGATVSTIQGAYLGNITFPAIVDAGSSLLSTAIGLTNLNTPLTTATNVFGVLVTTGAYTPGANSEVVGITLEVQTAS